MCSDSLHVEVLFTELFFRQAAKDGVAPLRRSKLMLVGQDGSGKSCTLRTLLNEPFEETIPSTIAMDFASIDRTEAAGWTKKKDGDRELHFMSAAVEYIAPKLRELQVIDLSR